MTAQEIFDKVLTHLHEQNEPARTGKFCMYRTERGLKCAVGCLISDEDYDYEMETKSVEGLSDRNLLPPELVPHTTLLGALQRTHDHCYMCNELGDRYSRADTRRYLHKVLLNYGLKPESFNWEIADRYFPLDTELKEKEQDG